MCRRVEAYKQKWKTLSPIVVTPNLGSDIYRKPNILWKILIWCPRPAFFCQINAEIRLNSFDSILSSSIPNIKYIYGVYKGVVKLISAYITCINIYLRVWGYAQQTSITIFLKLNLFNRTLNSYWLYSRRVYFAWRSTCTQWILYFLFLSAYIFLNGIHVMCGTISYDYYTNIECVFVCVWRIENGVNDWIRFSW